MELNPENEARVRDAIERARADADALLLLRSEKVMKGVERLAMAWEALHPAAQGWLEAAAEHGLPTDGSRADAGQAARAFLEHHKGKQGERPRSSAVWVAAQELFATYVETGGVPEVGNRAYRERAEIDEHPACEFVAQHLLRLFPDELGDLVTARRRADSCLRAMDADSEIPTRKKRRKSAES